MTARTRLWVLAVSTPVIAFAIIGGYLGQAFAKDEPYRYLAVFDDVLKLVEDNYVEKVDLRGTMGGAMRGLTDALDPDSGFLSADLVKTFDSAAQEQAADVGLELTRQYYLRVVSARDGSPAARAGLRTGDYIRAIDGRSTRDMSAYEGRRLMRGTAGSKVSLLVIRNTAIDPHEVSLVRERINGPEVTSRMADAATGYVRILDFTKDTAPQLQQAFDALARTGATRYVLDLRGAARGDLDDGVAAARLFVKDGTLAVRKTKSQNEPFQAQATQAVITAPVALLVDQGTAGAAEIFAAALDGNGRADLVGERTLGRAARQQLLKLPDGSGLLLTTTRYLTPSSVEIHERGLTPDVEVEQPDIEFGAKPPAEDPTLDKALERLTVKKAA